MAQSTFKPSWRLRMSLCMASSRSCFVRSCTRGMQIGRDSTGQKWLGSKKNRPSRRCRAEPERWPGDKQSRPPDRPGRCRASPGRGPSQWPISTGWIPAGSQWRPSTGRADACARRWNRSCSPATNDRGRLMARNALPALHARPSLPCHSPLSPHNGKGLPLYHFALLNSSIHKKGEVRGRECLSTCQNPINSQCHEWKETL